MEFYAPEDAAQALYYLHGSTMSEHSLHVEAYRPPQGKARSKTWSGRPRKYEAGQRRSRNAWRVPEQGQLHDGDRSASSMTGADWLGGSGVELEQEEEDDEEEEEEEEEEYQGPLIVDGRGRAGLGFVGLFDDVEDGDE